MAGRVVDRQPTTAKLNGIQVVETFGHCRGLDLVGTQIETSFEEEILRTVEKRGITLMRTSPWYVYMGSCHGVMLNQEASTIAGVADPRRRGMAKGL